MFRPFVKTYEVLGHLRKEQRGVVSFEYVAVAACVIGTVGAVFGTNTGAGIAAVLTTMLNAIITAVQAVVV